eukprot:Opistho-2@75422
MADVVVKVEFPETQTQKTVKLIGADTVTAALEVIRKKFGSSAPDMSRYSLFHPARNLWLEASKNIGDYHLAANDVLHLLPTGSTVASYTGPVFGAPLQLSTQVNNYGSVPYPVLVENVFDYISRRAMDMEGIFRLSGAASQIQKYKEKFDKGEKVDLEECNDPHVVAGLFKLFLREMPEPLLTFSLFDVFVAAQSAPDLTERARYFRAAIAGLPAENRALLKRTAGFMLKLSELSSVNKMGLENLATMLGPNIMRKRGETVMEMVHNTAVINSTANDLIRLYPRIFEYEGEENIAGVARVVYRYEPQAEGELPLTEDSIVFLTRPDGGDGWAEGESGGWGGHFPANYIEVLFYTGVVIVPREPEPAAVQSGDEGPSISAAQFKEDIVRLQKKAKQIATSRAEQDPIVSMLADGFASLQKKVASLEAQNEALVAELAALKESVASRAAQ